LTPATIRLEGEPIDAASVGGKAYALNRLIAVGARIPPTGSITTAGYRQFVEGSGLSGFLTELQAGGPPAQADLESDAKRVDSEFLAAAMPVELGDAIRRLASEVRHDGQVAVRSSATAEDTAAASFAGQYRSFLEVGDDEELLRAVRLVWSSLWHPAPRAYRAHGGVSERELAMAVVVMRMVDAVRSGVIFTVNPAGSTTEMRIEAVDGLAEKLVSGEVTPDAWVVSRIAARRRSIDPLIDEVIAAALDIEARFGAPQDVEWAHDGELLYVVQARPITTVGAPTVDTGDGFDSSLGPDDTYTTAGIAESMPGVLPPLQWTTAGPLLENGFRHLFDEMGALPGDADRVQFLARVRGRVVLSLDLMKAAALEVPGGSSDEIERQYFGRVISDDEPARPGATRRGPFKGVRTMLAGAREIGARRRFRFEAEASIDAIQRLVADPPDCGTASASDLLAYRHRVLDLAARVMAAEVAVAASAAAAYRGVELFLEPHVGAEAAGLAQQLTAGGINPCGAQVALHTCELTRQALAHTELAGAVEGILAGKSTARQALAEIGRGSELIAAVDAELARAGSSAVFSGETWAESEDLAWRLLSQAVQVERRGRPKMRDPNERADLLATIEARFSTSWKYRMQRVMTGQIVDLRKRMLRRLAADAVEFLHLREKTKSAMLALGGEVRRIHLAIGRQLVDAGVLALPAEVDVLASYELEGALAGEPPTAWELRRRREALDRLAEAEPLPQIFTGDPSRRVGEVAANDGKTFSGWAASSGTYEGTARVLAKATDPIEPGDILVARTTDPAWTPLFLTAGAIVVEEGGPLSHAAIIARELGLPAVLNVPGFLRRIEGRSGWRLRVDGDQGTVRILDENPERVAPAPNAVAAT
jgi:pyruvate,water dikinase